MSDLKKKTAVQEMRELHEEIKKNIKPSKTLLEIFSKKKKNKNETEKKIAKSYPPEAGV